MIDKIQEINRRGFILSSCVLLCELLLPEQLKAESILKKTIAHMVLDIEK